MRVLLYAALLFSAAQAFAQRGGGGGGQNPPIASLKTVAVPLPTGLDQYVLDQTALVVQPGRASPAFSVTSLNVPSPLFL